MMNRLMHGFAALLVAVAALGMTSSDALARHRSHEGTVYSVDRIGHRDNHLGAGTAIGAIAGGLLGNTVGHGDGRKAATVAGALAGGAVGHHVEKKHRDDDTRYRIRVRMDDGREISYTQYDSYGLRRGDRVRVDRGHVEPVRWR
jgi:outer membrane lipoprotein SlyB